VLCAIEEVWHEQLGEGLNVIVDLQPIVKFGWTNFN